jgi:hypothetical protein
MKGNFNSQLHLPNYLTYTPLHHHARTRERIGAIHPQGILPRYLGYRRRNERVADSGTLFSASGISFSPFPTRILLYLEPRRILLSQS